MRINTPLCVILILSNLSNYDDIYWTSLLRLILIHDYKTILSSFIKSSGPISHVEKFPFITKFPSWNFPPISIYVAFFQCEQKWLILLFLPLKKNKKKWRCLCIKEINYSTTKMISFSLGGSLLFWLYCLESHTVKILCKLLSINGEVLGF